MIKTFLSLLFLIFLSTTLNSQSNNGYTYHNASILKTIKTELIIPNKHLIFPQKAFLKEEDMESISAYKYKNFKKKYSLKKEHRKTKIDYLSTTNEAILYTFRKNSIKDRVGVDIYFFPKNDFPKLEVYLSNDKQEWEYVGDFTTDKPYIDLDHISKKEFTYLKIKKHLNCKQEINIENVALNKAKDGKIGLVSTIEDDKVFTENEKILLQLYDYKIFDLDRVSIRLNGKLISKNKILSKWNRFVVLKLKEGENKITIKALNEGLIKSNTVDLKIVDGIKINVGAFKLRKKKKKTILVYRI